MKCLESGTLALRAMRVQFALRNYNKIAKELLYIAIAHHHNIGTS